jgi:hypothetical protein
MAKRRKEDGKEDKKDEDEADGEPSKYKASGSGKEIKGDCLFLIYGGFGRSLYF